MVVMAGDSKLTANAPNNPTPLPIVPSPIPLPLIYTRWLPARDALGHAILVADSDAYLSALDSLKYDLTLYAMGESQIY